MEKEKIRKIILSWTQHNKEFTFGKIKELIKNKGEDLLDDDIIHCAYDEGWNESDSGMDPHYYLEVVRIQLETDEDFEERKKIWEKMAERNKKARYENYLALKKEFENN